MILYNLPVPVSIPVKVFLVDKDGRYVVVCTVGTIGIETLFTAKIVLIIMMGDCSLVVVEYLFTAKIVLIIMMGDCSLVAVEYPPIYSIDTQKHCLCK